MVEGSGQGWSHWHSWSQAVCGGASLLSWYYFELWCVVSAFEPALITTQSPLLRVEWVLQERKVLKRFSSNIEASSFWESYFKGNSGGKSGSSRFRAKEESGGRVYVWWWWERGWQWATGREVAVHAKWSQLPLVYRLIPAPLQPVIQSKLLSLVVKHFWKHSLSTLTAGPFGGGREEPGEWWDPPCCHAQLLCRGTGSWT